MKTGAPALKEPLIRFKSWIAYAVGGGVLGFFLALAVADYAALHYQLIGLGLGISLNAKGLVLLSFISAVVCTAAIFKKFAASSIVPLGIGLLLALLLNSLSFSAGKDLELWPPTLSEWLLVLAGAAPGNIVYGSFIILIGFLLSKAVDWLAQRLKSDRFTEPRNHG